MTMTHWIPVFFLNAFNSAPFAVIVLAMLFRLGALWSILLAVATGAVFKVVYLFFINRVQPVSENECVFITGTSKGLGFANVVHLVEQGYTVFAGVRTDKDASKLRESVKKIHRHRVVPVIIDVVKQETIDAAYQQVKEHLLEKKLVLRAVLNNSALANFGALEIVDIEKVKQMYDVNVFGMLRVNQAFLPLLRETAHPSRVDRRARLVMMSSATAHVTSPWMGAYSSTKQAIESLANGYRMELLGTGIDVCIVEPGKMHTESQQVLNDLIPSREELHKTTKGHAVGVIDEYSKCYERARVNLQKFATSPTRNVSVTIEHIIRANYAQTRYQCSADATVGALILGQLPDVVTDYMMRHVVG